MNNINVKKTKLLAILKKNRSEHRDEFLAAQKAYRKVVIDTLDTELAAVRNGNPFLVLKFTSLIQPTDHTDDYDRVIGMMELDISTVVELSEQEYRCYVDDHWGWMRQFANVASQYGVSNSKLARYASSQDKSQ